jgi:hypothetical protein
MFNLPITLAQLQAVIAAQEVGGGNQYALAQGKFVGLLQANLNSTSIIDPSVFTASPGSILSNAQQNAVTLAAIIEGTGVSVAKAEQIVTNLTQPGGLTSSSDVSTINAAFATDGGHVFVDDINSNILSSYQTRYNAMCVAAQSNSDPSALTFLQTPVGAELFLSWGNTLGTNGNANLLSLLSGQSASVSGVALSPITNWNPGAVIDAWAQSAPSLAPGRMSNTYAYESTFGGTQESAYGFLAARAYSDAGTPVPSNISSFLKGQTLSNFPSWYAAKKTDLLSDPQTVDDLVNQFAAGSSSTVAGGDGFVIDQQAVTASLYSAIANDGGQISGVPTINAAGNLVFSSNTGNQYLVTPTGKSICLTSDPNGNPVAVTYFEGALLGNVTFVGVQSVASIQDSGVIELKFGSQTFAYDAFAGAIQTSDGVSVAHGTIDSSSISVVSSEQGIQFALIGSGTQSSSTVSAVGVIAGPSMSGILQIAQPGTSSSAWLFDISSVDGSLQQVGTAKVGNGYSIYTYDSASSTVPLTGNPFYQEYVPQTTSALTGQTISGTPANISQILTDSANGSGVTATGKTLLFVGGGGVQLDNSGNPVGSVQTVTVPNSSGSPSSYYIVTPTNGASPYVVAPGSLDTSTATATGSGGTISPTDLGAGGLQIATIPGGPALALQGNQYVVSATLPPH